VFECYQNRRVLITGNTGFKGSWLTLWLKKLGADIAGLSIDIPTQPSIFEALGMEKEIKHYWADVRKNEEVDAVFKEFKPEIVFHLAAQPIVSESYRNPRLTFETNVLGMVNIMSAITSCPGVKGAVLITSDKCYENVEWPYGYRENDRLGGKDPYSASKACAELVAYAYHYSFLSSEDAPLTVTTRAGNVIGGGDWAPNRLVPDIVRSWEKQEELVVRSPDATRPWQHVLEPLSGYLCLGEKLLKGDKEYTGRAFNFGPLEGAMKSVETLVKAFSDFWPDAQWKVVRDGKMKESSLLKLDCSRSQHELDWSAVLNFSETITFTAEWYKKFYESNEDIKSFTLGQIDDYIEMARNRMIAWSMT